MAVRDLVIHVSETPRLAYSGRELRPHFIRTHFKVAGDAAVSFRGPCDVRGGALVDLEDRELGLFIHSADMVHFLVEIFGSDLTSMVLLQRLLATIVADRVRSALDPAIAAEVRREGDDVYVRSGKLSVSIATVSAVSSLIHFGVNVDTEGTPVPTAGLGPLGIDPAVFARGVLEDLRDEVRGVGSALVKVRPVHDEADDA